MNQYQRTQQVTPIQMVREVVWKYNPADEEGFAAIFETFVNYWGKQEAGRLLIQTPATVEAWINKTRIPKAHVRAGLKTRMVEVLSDPEKFR
jgi:hypothetical protein